MSEPPDKEEVMRSLGIIQRGHPLLTSITRAFRLPDEAGDARLLLAKLERMASKVAAAHDFKKGLGIAAPQIEVGRAAAIVWGPDGERLSFLNPVLAITSSEADEQYEGCLSFFGVRGLVPRPLEIVIEHQKLDGGTEVSSFTRGMARLVCHEIDHLFGVLYVTRMRPEARLIPLSQYGQDGQRWVY